MKNKIILLLLMVCQLSFAQLTRENIFKDGTTITYIVKKLYKVNDTIKERKAKDTIQLKIKKTALGLEIIRNNLRYKGTATLLDTINQRDFYSLLDTDTNKNIKYRDFALSTIQYNNESILVNEGTLNSREYTKSTKLTKLSFQLNDSIITLPTIYYTESKPDPEFKVELAFLDVENFPIQTHLLYITDSQYYFSATIYKLVSIEAKK